MGKVGVCGSRSEAICISAPPLRTCDLCTSPCQFRMQVCRECNCCRVGQMLHGGRERKESQVKRWGALHAQINVCSTWDRLWKRSHAGGDGLCLRDLYLWLDKSPLRSYFFSVFNEEECSAVRCALTPSSPTGRLSLITIYRQPRLDLPGLHHERESEVCSFHT